MFSPVTMASARQRPIRMSSAGGRRIRLSAPAMTVAGTSCPTAAVVAAGMVSGVADAGTRKPRESHASEPPSSSRILRRIT
jgi:hypothetical protein